MSGALIFLAILVAAVGYNMLVEGAGVCGASCNPSNAGQPITNDPSTWPSGDKIWDICHAVALAEGANIAGSVPDRLNNPGDISDGLLTYGSEYADGSAVTKFPDKQTGWQWLYNKFQNIIAGGSSTYASTLSWSGIASKYAGDSSSWLNNVISQLGVSPDSTPADYVNGTCSCSCNSCTCTQCADNFSCCSCGGGCCG